MKLYIGENLKKYRVMKNVTQERLAEYLGVTFQAVSRWETGAAYPDIELLPDIARFFEVTLEELLGTESNDERIEKILHECCRLRERDREAALVKLRALEREFPNNWGIKTQICYTLAMPAKTELADYEKVLPELRRYGYEALEHCTVKDYCDFRKIAALLLKTVPEDEMEEWSKYVFEFPIPNYYLVKEDRYRERKELEKANENRSLFLMDWFAMIYHVLTRNEVEAAEMASSRELVLRLMDVLFGVPCRENGKVSNSLAMDYRIPAQLQLAAAYGDLGMKEECLRELEKAVELWILYADALKDGVLTCDSPFLEAEETDYPPLLTLESGIEVLTASVGWSDCVRETAEYQQMLKRLYDKKAALESEGYILPDFE